MTVDQPERRRAAQRLLWCDRVYYAALAEHERERTEATRIALTNAQVQLELAEREALAVGRGRRLN